MLKALMIAAAMIAPTAALADDWTNRGQVVLTGEQLGEKVEIFDEALHGITAPDEVISMAHHLEETVAEFVALAKTGTRTEVGAELKHLNEDIDLLQRRLGRSDMPRNADVRAKWFSLRDAATRLNRQFRWFL